MRFMVHCFVLLEMSRKSIIGEHSCDLNLELSAEKSVGLLSD